MMKKLVKITESQYKKIIKESEDEIDYGFFFTKVGNYFYLILMDSSGDVVGYIRLYRNKDKGFSRDTFAAESGLGKYMLMFNFAVAKPHPVTVDRGKGTNRAAYNAIDKFVNSNNIITVPIPEESPDYVHIDNPTDFQQKYFNTYMYSSADNSFIKEFINNGKIIMHKHGLSPQDVVNKAEDFFKGRYSGL